jgi:hypothetical protein
MDTALDSTRGRTPGSDLPGGGPAVSHTPGRALTPRDLAAQRGAIEACAFLSAEAALLAVLVARIGEREQIVIHPGDLIDELRGRLDWRDVPAALHPKRIGAWLRRLGFSPVGRDRLGVKYEIHWHQLWQLDPRAVSAEGEGLDLLALEGAALVRLLVQEQQLFFAPRIWCPTCRGVVATLWGDPAERRGELWPCLKCGSSTRVLEATWLQGASDRIRTAIRKDRNLLPRVKAEWNDLHDGAPFVRLPEPFAWLNAAWQKAGRPRGRPTAVRERYALAHAVEQLERAGVSESDIEEIFRAYGLTRQKHYDTLPARVHRFLGPCDAGFAVDLPSVHPRTLWADVQWVRRQWTNPRSRLSGEGNFPATIPKEEIGMDAPAVLAPLRSPDPLSHMREGCPKCRNKVLATHQEGSLLWVRCWACGWSAPVRG